MSLLQALAGESRRSSECAHCPSGPLNLLHGAGQLLTIHTRMPELARALGGGYGKIRQKEQRGVAVSKVCNCATCAVVSTCVVLLVVFDVRETLEKKAAEPLESGTSGAFPAHTRLEQEVASVGRVTQSGENY